MHTISSDPYLQGLGANVFLVLSLNNGSVGIPVVSYPNTSHLIYTCGAAPQVLCKRVTGSFTCWCAAVGVHDLGDHSCQQLCALASTPAALANTNFILRRKAAYRGSEVSPGVIYRTECPRVQRTRANANRAAHVAAQAAAGPQPGDKDDPMEIDEDGPWIGGGSGPSPNHCVVSKALARILQGLIVERYLHQRQSAELRRQKATADLGSQASQYAT